MKHLSNMTAADDAFRQMTGRLFKPFKFTTWLMLGLCAWLAQIGTEMGAYVNEIAKFIFRQYIKDDQAAIQAAVSKIEQGNIAAIGEIIDFDGLLAINPAWIVLGIVAVSLLALLLLWIRCQASLVFIDNLIHKSTRIMPSFRENLALGNSIFLWKILYYAINPVIVLGGAALPLLLTIGWIRQCLAESTLCAPDATAITGLILSFTLLLILGITMKLLLFYFEQFVIPIVFIRRQNAFRATATWARLFKYFTWTFIKYAILYLLCAAVALLSIICLGLATCCIAILLMIIPYIGILVILPIPVFFQLFSLELLNQMYKHKIF